MSVEFKEFPKMARLSREIIITEKIDGTNASIFIQNEILEEENSFKLGGNIIAVINGFTIRAGSRTRWITPQDDNMGFARWVSDNAQELVKLGEGHHFGEWWGSGIQRGYNLPNGEKRFSLFNMSRWGIGGKDEASKPECCYVVPVLYKGVFDTFNIDEILNDLKIDGSKASPGFTRPEGIVVFHTAGNVGFKKTIEKDEIPKSLQK